MFVAEFSVVGRHCLIPTGCRSCAPQSQLVEMFQQFRGTSGCSADSSEGEISRRYIPCRETLRDQCSPLLFPNSFQRRSVLLLTAFPSARYSEGMIPAA